MNKSLKLFYQFLEANGALIAWEQNYTNRQAEVDDPKSRAEFFYTLISHQHSWIGAAFLWSDTPQGHYYWDQLDNKWRNHLNGNI